MRILFFLLRVFGLTSAAAAVKAPGGCGTEVKAVSVPEIYIEG